MNAKPARTCHKAVATAAKAPRPAISQRETKVTLTRESAGCSQARARCQLQAWQAGASLGVKQSAAHAMGTERPDRLFDATEQTSANQAHR